MHSALIPVLFFIGVVCSSQDFIQSELVDELEFQERLGIYDGKNTKIKNHPYVVSLVKNGSSFCAGTILNNEWILTNGDCVHNKAMSDITVVAGSNDGLTGTKYSIQQIVLHPEYGKAHLDYDYACVQIDGIFKWSNTVKAADLPSSTVQDYSWLTVAGYGSTNTVKGSNGNQLKQGSLQWLNKDVCQTMLSSISITWTDRFACAYNAGKTTLCQGDFGDALVLDNVVYAIFTAGVTKNFCSENSMPSILADVFTVEDWIKSTINA